MRVKVSFGSNGQTVKCQSALCCFPWLLEFVPLSHEQIWQQKKNDKKLACHCVNSESNHNRSKLSAWHYPFNTLGYGWSDGRMVRWSVGLRQQHLLDHFRNMSLAI